MGRYNLFSAKCRQTVRQNPKKFAGLYFASGLTLPFIGYGIEKLVALLQANAPLPLTPLNNASQIPIACNNYTSYLPNATALPDNETILLFAIGNGSALVLLIPTVILFGCAIRPSLQFVYGTATYKRIYEDSDDSSDEESSDQDHLPLIENGSAVNEGLCTGMPRFSSDYCRQLARHHPIARSVMTGLGCFTLIGAGVATTVWQILQSHTLTPLNNTSNIPPECYNFTPSAAPDITSSPDPQVSWIELAIILSLLVLTPLFTYFACDVGRATTAEMDEMRDEANESRLQDRDPTTSSEMTILDDRVRHRQNYGAISSSRV